MKVLLTGAAGQLGHALRQQVPQGVELIASSRTGTDGTGDGSHANAAIGWIALDLADPGACREAVYQYKPDWVLNGGAYTAVDKAESEPELAHVVDNDSTKPPQSQKPATQEPLNKTHRYHR